MSGQPAVERNRNRQQCRIKKICSGTVQTILESKSLKRKIEIFLWLPSLQKNLLLSPRSNCYIHWKDSRNGEPFYLQNQSLNATLPKTARAVESVKVRIEDK